MATEWFKNNGTGVSVHSEDPHVLLISTDPPDWVMIPEDSPEMPGRKMRVTGQSNWKCPVCKMRIVRHLHLEDRFRVAECMPKPDGCGFIFYKASR